MNYARLSRMEIYFVHILQNGKVFMKAKKKFYVIAYDTSSVKRRQLIVKLLEPYGKRINYSVYECMFTEAQLSELVRNIRRIVIAGKDQVVMYKLCLDCYAGIMYIPDRRTKIDTVVIA